MQIAVTCQLHTQHVLLPYSLFYLYFYSYFTLPKNKYHKQTDSISCISEKKKKKHTTLSYKKDKGWQQCLTADVYKLCLAKSWILSTTHKGQTYVPYAGHIMQSLDHQPKDLPHSKVSQECFN
jgi:TRAP-type uncharacterized transport system substrate-binding protein